MSHLVDIIIPTYNNRRDLESCLVSLFANGVPEELFRVIVVNNGQPDSCEWLVYANIFVIHPGQNLGWEGALKLALTASGAPFVCFLNDDTFFPHFSREWLHRLLQHFDDPEVGAVGPSSNAVMGWQNIFGTMPYDWLEVRFLIGYCLLLRRSALDEAGGIDDTLPGGDDFDLSIRLRRAGYRLIADRDVFVYHRGSRTGERVHGGPNDGGWNSPEMVTATNHALIVKHGFETWRETLHEQIVGAYVPPARAQEAPGAAVDSAGTGAAQPPPP